MLHFGLEQPAVGISGDLDKGKQLGRPRAVVDAARIASLRAQGTGWKKIAAQLEVGVGTVLHVAQEARQRVQQISLAASR